MGSSISPSVTRVDGKYQVKADFDGDSQLDLATVAQNGTNFVVNWTYAGDSAGTNHQKQDTLVNSDNNRTWAIDDVVIVDGGLKIDLSMPGEQRRDPALRNSIFINMRPVLVTQPAAPAPVVAAPAPVVATPAPVVAAPTPPNFTTFDPRNYGTVGTPRKPAGSTAETPAGAPPANPGQTPAPARTSGLAEFNPLDFATAENPRQPGKVTSPLAPNAVIIPNPDFFATGKVISVTDANFDQQVFNQPVPVIVDFNASWCGPCTTMKPIFEKLAAEFKGKVKFCSVDTDANQATAQKMEISGIPHFVFIGANSTSVTTDQTGSMSEVALRQLIKSTFGIN